MLVVGEIECAETAFSLDLRSWQGLGPEVKRALIGMRLKRLLLMAPKLDESDSSARRKKSKKNALIVEVLYTIVPHDLVVVELLGNHLSG